MVTLTSPMDTEKSPLQQIRASQNLEKTAFFYLQAI
jgi:hypothetical protein